MDEERESGTEPAEADGEQTEETPLLQSNDPTPSPACRSLLTSLQRNGKGAKRRWPSLIALLVLCLTVVLIIIFVFLAPSTVMRYAHQAAVFHPTSVSIAGITRTGVLVRIHGDFTMDAYRVRRKAVRDIGRFFTAMARKAETGDGEVEILLPEYGNLLLGTAYVPGIKVDIRAGKQTPVDFEAELIPGEADGLRHIAEDWVDSRLGQLRVRGKALVPLRSGIIRLGRQMVEHDLILTGNDLPSMPSYDVENIHVGEMDRKGVSTNATLMIQNDYSVDMTLPPLALDVLVDNCHRNDPYIKLATVHTGELNIVPKQNVQLDITSDMHELPNVLTQDCPGSKQSPLDAILGQYMHGKDTRIYVRGSRSGNVHTPTWMSDILAEMTIPVPVPGKSFGRLIKDFTMADTHLSLPDPLRDTNPRLSATIRAIVELPGQFNLNVSVNNVKADADIFYKDQILGKLDLHKWQAANSTCITSSGNTSTIEVESRVHDAPIHITNESVFAGVMHELLLGEGVTMLIKANVDIKMRTGLGELTVRRIPAKGEVPIEPITPGNNGSLISALDPQVCDFQVLDTTPSSLTLRAVVNVTNPTDHSATIPYVDVQVFANKTLLGHATVRNAKMKPKGRDTVDVTVVYDPADSGGREFVSQYISGYNTTLTLQAHEGTIPSQPSLGNVLSKLPINITTPHLDRISHFLESATMHLLSSTAQFSLLSPLRREVIFITSINASASYHGDLVGIIETDLPFAIAPGGVATTPRLPVEWSPGGMGYDAVKRALGGKLRLSAFANVGVRIGHWRDRVWFQGHGIGAFIRL
ncbi:hypothetical protein K470DRAFT_209021 [Piedraia hortae CBS 480.64]|uniref:Pre-rRNA processing protein n=1 Tax=Piedraia hortae CBS 480.64 TaxID=1314780 RepID=A0A6A7CA49_9PEZI|nr:hypothetical protein K470DRAFT_209021 [Piedraia hortae CBS 480.64]